MVKSIPKFYKRNAGDLYFFGWMAGVRKCLPSLSVKDCVLKFISDHNLIEGVDTEVRTLISTFYRMNIEHIKQQKEAVNG